MSKVFECFYMRAKILNGLEEIHYTRKHKRYEHFISQFQHIIINEKYFHKKSHDLTTFLKKHVWGGDERTKFIKRYSQYEWQKLDPFIQKEHTLNGCSLCKKDKNPENVFPSSVIHRPKKSNSPLSNIANIFTTDSQARNNILSFKNSNVAPLSFSKVDIPFTKNSLPYMKETCKSVLENINTSWNSLYDTPFLKIKKKLRKSHRKLNATIENHWEKYSKDTNTLFGVRQSRSTYLKIRSSLHFESKKDAVKRTTCFTSNAIGQKRKRHSPNPNNIDFNKVEMLNEVQKMKKGSEINLSALAKKYKIDGLNGNMVVREFLEQNNVDITAFSSTKLNKTRVRRKLNKLSGSGISVPIPRSFKKIKEDLNQNITCGKYILGTLIEPKIYSSISTDKHGKIEISKSSISGRKISLHELRKKIFENHISQKII
ncbi:uncharacterized protein LOC136095227 [Hydra vulgaris]|uniref:uncharacterized protein LOC136095227 n=1 Tax=Hydra vulgaris TaxID=6087 RepID=UPI0032E9E95F